MEYSSKMEKRSKNLIMILSLSESMDQLATVESDRWYGHVLRREGSHVLRWGVRC